MQYREFWIEKEAIGHSGCFKAFFYDDPGIFKDDHENLIHVIEYSAYTDAIKKIAELEKENSELRRQLEAIKAD